MCSKLSYQHKIDYYIYKMVNMSFTVTKKQKLVADRQNIKRRNSKIQKIMNSQKKNTIKQPKNKITLIFLTY